MSCCHAQSSSISTPSLFLAYSLSHVQPSARSSPTFCHASSPVPSKSKLIVIVSSRSQTNKHPSQSRLNVTGCYMPRKLWRPEVFPSHIPFTMAPLPPPPRGQLASSPVGLALQKGTASPAPSSVPTQVPETTSAAPSSVPGPAPAANPFRGLRAGGKRNYKSQTRRTEEQEGEDRRAPRGARSPQSGRSNRSRPVAACEGVSTHISFGGSRGIDGPSGSDVVDRSLGSRRT